eukprot:5369142-Pyramimonas_sp.AAC.1
MAQFQEGPVFAMLRKLSRGDDSHAMGIYMCVQWGSQEIFETNWADILDVLVPIELGAPPRALARGGCGAELWIQMDERSEDKATLLDGL